MPTERRLTKPAVLRVLEGVKGVNQPDIKRVQQAAELIGGDSHEASLGATVNTLFADTDADKRMAAFRSFRERLSKATMVEGKPKLALRVDAKTKTPAGERRCWFEGADDIEARVKELTLSTFKKNATNLPKGEAVGNRGQALTESELKPDARLLIWHDPDDPTTAKLAEALRISIGSLNRDISITTPESVVVGDPTRERALSLVSEADVVVSLLTTTFLNKACEPLSVDDLAASSRVVPVYASTIADGARLGPLEGRKPFGMKRDSGRHHRVYSKCQPEERAEFVSQLTDTIDGLLPSRSADDAPNATNGILDLLRGQSPERARGLLSEFLPGGVGRDAKGAITALLSDAGELDGSAIEVIENLAKRLAMSSDAATEGAAATSSDEKALDMLIDWACEGEQLYCSVLGEYGIGKTTTLAAFALRLIDLWAAGETDRVPIFLDFRNPMPSLDNGGHPELEAILNEAIDAVWPKRKSGKPSADEILELVESHKAILIFDGLDEKLVHMSQSAGRNFIQQLFRALPAWEHRDGPPDGIGRLVFSCRSSYFRTLQEQSSAFLAQHRDDVRGADYFALSILPFNEEQIREYLGRLHVEDIDGTIEFFASVHNLQELAQRPYLLRLISDQLGDLEAQRARGERVLGVSLYRHFVNRWLERDQGKHRLAQEDKVRLMQDLAFDMWCAGDREWAWDRVRAWLRTALTSDPTLAIYLGGGNEAVEKIEEDFRTATFILRRDRSEASFRFAHTSMHEYFLAERLLRAAIAGETEPFLAPGVSDETVEFLGQLVALATSGDQNRALETLNTVLAAPSEASKLVLRYWVRALARAYPVPKHGSVDLSGLDFEGFAFEGVPERPLDLSGAVFRGASLRHSVFRNASLQGADLRGVDATRAEFHGIGAGGARFDASSVLIGTHWRGGSLAGTGGFADADWHDAHLVGVDAPAESLTMTPRRRPSSASSAPALGFSDTSASTLEGHSFVVQGCAWSPDGTKVLSASSDNTLGVWDANSGKRLLTLEGHTKQVQGCAWSPDGRKLLSASRDNTLGVWDANSGKRLLTLEGHTSQVQGCAWSPDGAKLLSASSDNTLGVWDANSGKRLLTLEGHTNEVQGCAWSPDGIKLLSASDDHTLGVWDANSGKRLLTLEGHTNPVQGCAWSPDGTKLLSASDDHTLGVWDANSGKRLLTLEGHTIWVRGCAWSPDGTKLLSASCDSTLGVWDANSGKRLLTLEGHTNEVHGCAWAPDGTKLLSASYDHMLGVWDANSGKRLLTLEGHTNWVRGCAWAPDGTKLLSASYDHTLGVWDVNSGKRLLTLEGHTNEVHGCAWAPDGTKLLSASYDHTLGVWDANSGKRLLILEGHTDAVQGCAWSPDGTKLLSASDDETLRVWDADSGKRLLTLEGHTDAVQGCAWSPDGTKLLSAALDNTLGVWDANSGRRLLTLEGHTNWVQGCAWCPDGTKLLSAAWDNTLGVWDANSGKRLLTLEGHTSQVQGCAWSPNGSKLLSASEDHTLGVWDANSGKRLLTLEGHTDAVLGCAWCPDGTKLLSASYDNTLGVWDTESGQRLIKVLSHRDSWVSINPVNNRFLAAGPKAWRIAGWRYFDEDFGHTRVLPLEAFGPIEGLAEPGS